MISADHWNLWRAEGMRDTVSMDLTEGPELFSGIFALSSVFIS